MPAYHGIGFFESAGCFIPGFESRYYMDGWKRLCFVDPALDIELAVD